MLHTDLFVARDKCIYAAREFLYEKRRKNNTGLSPLPDDIVYTQQCIKKRCVELISTQHILFIYLLVHISAAETHVWVASEYAMCTHKCVSFFEAANISHLFLILFLCFRCLSFAERAKTEETVFRMGSGRGRLRRSTRLFGGRKIEISAVCTVWHGP